MIAKTEKQPMRTTNSSDASSPDDELVTFFLHPDSQYRTEHPAPVTGYAIPPMPEYCEKSPLIA